MSEPKKIRTQTIKQFPGGTWNELVEGEFRDRVPKSQPQQPAPTTPPSTVFVQLIWMGDTDLPPGSVVSLTEPPRFFEDDHSVPFSGLQFKCDAPATATLDAPFAITSTPINLVAGKKSMGWGYIPGACWAQVDINSTDDETAELLDGETILSSTTDGRVPIIWKPTGTGAKWCVIQLASSPGAAAPGMIHAWVACDEPADSPGGTFLVTNPWDYTPPDGDDPAAWELKDPTTGWYIDQGSVTHLQTLDEEDSPSLVEVDDPLFKRPNTGDYCLICAPAGETRFRLIDRRCAGGEEAPDP